MIVKGGHPRNCRGPAAGRAEGAGTGRRAAGGEMLAL
jgi:hypothetical protein